MSIVLPRYCCAIGVESARREKASLRTEAKTFTWWLTRRSWYAVSTSAICDRCQTLGDVSPASLERDSRLMMCLLKYSSMLSMKIATGRLMSRSRGTRRSSVSVAQRRGRRGGSRAVDEVVDDALQVGSATRAVRRGLTSSAVDQVEPLQIGDGDRDQPDLAPERSSARRARASRAEHLVADRLVEQAVVRQADHAAALLVATRLAFSSSVLPKPLVPMTTNLSSRLAQELVDLRRPMQQAASKSSATRMSSASTVQARIAFRVEVSL